MTDKKVNYVCAHCKGDNLVFDGTAEWNVDAQKMELRDTYDSKPYCGDCDIEDWAETVEVQP